MNAVCDPAFMAIDVPAAHGPAFLLGEVFMRSTFLRTATLSFCPDSLKLDYKFKNKIQRFISSREGLNSDL